MHDVLDGCFGGFLVKVLAGGGDQDAQLVVVLTDLRFRDVEQIECLVEDDGMHSNQAAGCLGSGKPSSARNSTAARSLKGRAHGGFRGSLVGQFVADKGKGRLNNTVTTSWSPGLAVGNWSMLIVDDFGNDEILKQMHALVLGASRRRTRGLGGSVDIAALTVVGELLALVGFTTCRATRRQAANQ